MIDSSAGAHSQRVPSWARAEVLAYLGVSSFCVAISVAVGVSASPEWGVLAAVIFLGASALVLGLSGRTVAVLCMTMTAGVLQGLVAARTGAAAALWLDDACLPGVVAATALAAATSGRGRRFFWGAFVFLGASALAMALSPSLDVAIYQFRQVAVPATLLACGWTASRQVVEGFGRYFIWLGLIYVGFMGLEELGFRLADPWLASGLNPFTGGISESNLGRELPPNYYYFAGDQRLIRAGGLHFNPPGASLFVASILVYAQMLLPWTARRGVAIVSLAGVASTLGRGGGVYLAVLLGQRFVTQRIGRVMFGVLALVFGVVLADYFSGQGNKSDTHTQGLLTGVAYALTHPLGSGFGSIGNITGSASADGATGESLVGLFLASYGWLGLAAIIALLVRGVSLGDTVPGSALTAAILVSLFTESASGLALTLPMWLAAGIGLKPRSDLEGPDWCHARSERPTLMSSARLLARPSLV